MLLMIKESRISIFVKSMRVNIRIGLHDFQTVAPQPVDVSVELFVGADYLKRVQAGGDVVDYAQIHDAVLAWEERDHVELIEAYLEELLGLGFGFQDVIAVRASISKPDIFEKAQGAGVEVFMRRADWF